MDRPCPIRTLLSLVCLATVPANSATDDPGELAFFERKVRPVLAEHCYRCHSSESKKLRAGLRVDAREALLRGGDTGPTVVPGEPEASPLIEAIRYDDPDLSMPPAGKLPDTQINDLTRWVEMGAPWPEEVAEEVQPREETFDLHGRRRSHWSWQPIRRRKPPEVRDTAWPRQPVDRFILAQLEANEISPAPPASRRRLIRRLHFDLIGLPPTPSEVEQFVNDPSRDAYEKLVDRLLASPRFGERWARHWLDLVRYAETLGHEFDYARHHAWRYRDYVIRAFNADVPYDQFLTEQIAGDLLPEPRLHPLEEYNESLIGTGFYWFGQQVHSPVDVRVHEAEMIDNQIDVLTKTFLGLTVSCARCHDHKFDAISTRDFYALYGVLASSRYSQSAINAPWLTPERVSRLRQVKRELRPLLARAWKGRIESVPAYLLAADEAIRRELPDGELETFAAESGLEPKRLVAWKTLLSEPRRSEPTDPFFAWTQVSKQLSEADPGPPDTVWEQLSNGPSEPKRPAPRRIDPFAEGPGANPWEKWFPDGEAFGDARPVAGDFLVGASDKPVTAILTEPGLHSALWSRRLQGSLRSPSFTITNRFIHVRAAGRESRVNVVVRNFTLIRDPIYGGLKRVLDSEAPVWLTFDLDRWQGERAYLEFTDRALPDPADSARPKGYGANGYLALYRVANSDDRTPPHAFRSPDWRVFLSEDAPQDLAALADRYRLALGRAIDAWSASDPSAVPAEPADIDLLNVIVGAGVLGEGAADAEGRIAGLLNEYASLEESIPDPMLTPAIADGNGVDEHVFIRGNPRSPGAQVPRRLPEALPQAKHSTIGPGSGRLALARSLTDESNPFPARVMVNRVWQHLFGHGLVSTPDDFGVLGSPPSHPELLDWLAHRFRTEGDWSVKNLIRLLVTSSTYQMSSRPEDAEAEERDPANLLFHRMPVRRLEGEIIRDAILAVSGHLDTTPYGPPVATHLTPFMDGRGRPGRSGPLDGDGRRSIYLEVRNNFLSPMMRAFDTPVPFTTVGRRTVSNVPAQSLILLNDPFVYAEAERWARRLLDLGLATPQEAVNTAYRMAFGRPTTPQESVRAIEFIEAQSAAAGNADKPLRDRESAWADLCHVLFNSKEFIFVN